VRKNIIFISGIHGVGKTSLCNFISLKYKIAYYSASKLISDAKQHPFDSIFIDDISQNQEILTSSVEKLLNNSKDYLLDGHFCLINTKKEPERLPQKTFQNLRIKNIIILREDIDIIWNRLKNRNNIEYDLNMLCKLQEMELNYSREISLLLQVPYTVLNLSSLSYSSLINNLDSIFKYQL